MNTQINPAAHSLSVRRFALVGVASAGALLAMTNAASGAALAYADTSIATQPASTPTVQSAQQLIQQGDYYGAIEQLRHITKAQPTNPAGWYWLGYALHVSGDVEAAIDAHKAATKFPQTAGVATYNLACAYALTDQPDLAFKTLKAAARLGQRDVNFWKQDTDLASLHDDERWEPLLEHVREMAKNAPEKALHFWVGQWDCYSANTGSQAGTNTLAMRVSGNVIHESWTPTSQGSRGESWNWYNASTGNWHQTWVDASGMVADFIGAPRDGGIDFKGKQISPQGVVQIKMFVRPIGEGRVRQTGTQSTDGGQTWTQTYDLIYVKKGIDFSLDDLEL